MQQNRAVNLRSDSGSAAPNKRHFQCVAAESHEACLCCSKYQSFLVALPVLLGRIGKNPIKIKGSEHNTVVFLMQNILQVQETF